MPRMRPAPAAWPRASRSMLAAAQSRLAGSSRIATRARFPREVNQMRRARGGQHARAAFYRQEIRLRHVTPGAASCGERATPCTSKPRPSQRRDQRATEESGGTGDQHPLHARYGNAPSRADRIGFESGQAMASVGSSQRMPAAPCAS